MAALSVLALLSGFIQNWSLIHGTKIPAILVALRKSNDDNEFASMRVFQTHFVNILKEYSGIFRNPITSTEFSDNFVIEPEKVKGKFLVILDLDPLEDNEERIADMCSKAGVPQNYSLQLFVFGSTNQPFRSKQRARTWGKGPRPHSKILLLPLLPLLLSTAGPAALFAGEGGGSGHFFCEQLVNVVRTV